MIKQFTVTAVAVIAGLMGMAQTPTAEENFKKLTDFLPPSPNAASIIKNGELNANGNNGVAGFNIGLMGLSSKNLGVNVALSYSAGGIKVDEIAGRVGMGWSLQAGGVVTRMMRGKPDEFNTMRLPWATIGSNWATYNYFASIAGTPQTNSYDSEPDLFNFNAGGMSGSFIIGYNGQIIQNKETGIVIQTNFSSTEWNLKITATNGTIYYFGGTGAKELSKRTSICGKNYDQFWPTAWYLKKMEEPNGNSISFEYSPINFDYETGVSQSASTKLTLGDGTFCDGSSCGGTSYSNCANAQYVQGVLLTGIVKNSDGSRVNLTYTTRQDCDDKLLSRVELVNPASQTVKSYELLYDQISGQSYNGYTGGLTAVNYTPYLKELRQWNSSNTSYLSHKFKYNDPAARPQRLAFSQDHWGYFNGINNTTLIPTPVNAYEQVQLSSANANRGVNFDYAAKGVLNKIEYPTGAVDSVVYEPNIFTGAGKASIHQADCMVTGTGFSTQVSRNIAFTGQALYLEGGCIDNSGTGSFDPVHNKGTVEITDASGATLYSKLLTPGQTFNINFEVEGSITSGANQYYVKIYANGSVVSTWAKITFHPNTGTIPQQDLVGGLRVKSIFTNDGLGNINTKLYKYESLANPFTSSLVKYTLPVYRKPLEEIQIRTCYNTPNTAGVVYVYTCPRVTYSSNTQAGLFDFSGSAVSYNYVTEAADYRYTTGATETKFGVLNDAQGWQLWGPDALYQPVNNVSNLLNGVELEKNIFRRNESNNTLEPVSKTSSTYTLYNLQSVPVYQIQRRGDLGVPTDTVNTVPTSTSCYTSNLPCQMQMFNASKYEFLSATVNVQSQQQTVYSQENGGTPLVTSTTNYYDASKPWLLTKSETQNSINQTTDTRFTYPKDYAGQSVYDAMVQQNKTTSPVTIGNYNTNTEQSVIKTNYTNWGNGNIEASSITRSIMSNAFENEGTITQRDSKGNILELVGRDGVVKSFIWGYYKDYPVAAITGANYATALAQLTVSLTTLETLDGAALLTETHKIRQGLPNAFVVTYTYIPHVGLKTETDTHNRTTTYEYDAFNQLIVSRDHDGNIIKHMTYNYSGTGGNIVTSGANIYFNQATSNSFNCQNCMPGYTGEAVNYTVPAGKYFSKTSQADANALAQEEVNAKGQQNANLKGLCKSLVINNCSGVNKKIINCLCETGVKVYTNQVQTGPNSWTCTFHYEWSDGSWSPNYTESASAPCMGGLGGGIED